MLLLAGIHLLKAQAGELYVVVVMLLLLVVVFVSYRQ